MILQKITKLIIVIYCIISNLYINNTILYSKVYNIKKTNKINIKQYLQKTEFLIRNKNYHHVIQYLEKIIHTPNNRSMEKIYLYLIYSYFQEKMYKYSYMYSQKFIHLYPFSIDIDYVYYIKALSIFYYDKENESHFVDESLLDLTRKIQSYSDFYFLVKFFPHSPYRSDAIIKLIYLYNIFAKHELNIAYYYFKNKLYAVAIHRLMFLIKNYPSSSSIRQANLLLHRIYKIISYK